MPSPTYCSSLKARKDRFNWSVKFTTNILNSFCLDDYNCERCKCMVYYSLYSLPLKIIYTNF